MRERGDDWGKVMESMRVERSAGEKTVTRRESMTVEEEEEEGKEERRVERRLKNKG